jgi:hypothetical protein
VRGRKTDSNAFKKRTSLLRSIGGFTLVELSITVAVAAIGVFGMASLFSDMIKIQKQSSTNQMLTQMRVELISAISNDEYAAGGDSAWKRTISDISVATGVPWAVCLRDSLPCTKDTPVDLNLKRLDGNELFYAATATRGFTFDGRLCNTFSIATPDISCPLRWDLKVQARCPGASTASCVNPVVEVSGELLYSAIPTDALNGRLNTNKYGFKIRRGEKTNKNEPVMLSYVQPDALGESIVGNGCYQQWYTRKINTTVTDPGSNAVSVVAPGTFTLRSGTYECRIQVPAFKNGGNKIRINGTGVNVESAIVSASLSGESVTVTLQANFTLATDTALQIQHYCYEKPSLAPPENNAPNSTVPDNFMLGVPASDNGSYLGTTYTVVSCVKTSG